MAYGERFTLQSCIDILPTIKCDQVRQQYELCFRIFALDIVLKDAGFFLVEGLLNPQALKLAQLTLIQLVKTLAVTTGDIIESMNVPTHALYTPIAGDYIKYNAEPNFGEVLNAKL